MRSAVLAAAVALVFVPVRADAYELVDRFLGRPPPPRLPIADPARVQMFSAMQYRTTGSSTQLTGDILPVDNQMPMLCGSLLAWRLGAQLGRFGGYGIVGGGTWTVVRHRLPSNDRGQIGVDRVNAGYGFVGFGGEWEMYKSLVLAAELDLGGIALGQPGDVVMAPSPAKTVQSAVAALRFAY
ncbi:MAG: hypothetical protein ACXWUG_23855 [Polyangiales bacterium]